MKHVCVDARLYGETGIGAFLKTLIETLAKTPSIKLSLLFYEKDRALLRSLTPHLILLKSPIYTLKEQIELRRKIPPCDLFWAPHFNIPLLPIRAKKRVTTVHDVYHLAFFSTLTLSQKCYAKLFYNGCFVLSDYVTTPSEFSRREILKYATFSPKKLIVFPHPFKFDPSLNMKAKRDILLCVGNVKPHKNLRRVIHAYKILKPKEPLYIVGKKQGFVTIDAPLLQEVENDPFLKQNVFFTGYLSDDKLKELYTRAKVFLFVSYYEGLGRPPLEAMASGSPVIAARAASIPEVCHDAVEYVDPFSSSSIAEGIERLLTDAKRREELIERGKKRVEERRGNEKQILDVIDACCRCP